MADTNWALNGTKSKGYTAGGSGLHYVEYQTEEQIFDGNEATEYAIRADATSWTGWVNAWGMTEFATTHRVNKIEIHIGYQVSNYVNGHTSYLLEAYYSGAWNTVSTAEDIAVSYIFDNLGLIGVSKVRMSVYVPFGQTELYYDAIGVAILQECYVWGTDAIDIGISYTKANGTIGSVGVLPLVATHKLRVYNGTDIYGIPLVTVGDPLDSGIRIYDGTNVKALMHADN